MKKRFFFEFSKKYRDEFFHGWVLMVGFQNWVPVDMFYTTSHCQMSYYTSLKYPQISSIFMLKICGLMILREYIGFKMMFMIHFRCIFIPESSELTPKRPIYKRLLGRETCASPGWTSRRASSFAMLLIQRRHLHRLIILWVVAKLEDDAPPPPGDFRIWFWSTHWRVGEGFGVFPRTQNTS